MHDRPKVNDDVADTIRDRIGNPLFAIETLLDPLARRIAKNDKTEMLELAASLESSVETAMSRLRELKERYAHDKATGEVLESLKRCVVVIGMIASTVKNHLERTEIEQSLSTVSNLRHLVEQAKSKLP